MTTKYLLREIQNSIDRAIRHKKSTIDEFLQQLETFTLSNAWGDENNMRNALIFHQNIGIALEEISDALSLSEKDIQMIYERLRDYILSLTSGHDIKLTVRKTHEKGGDDETYEMNLTSTSLGWDLTWNLPVTQMYTLKYVIMDAKQQIDSTVVGDSLLRGGYNLRRDMDLFQNGAKLILTFEKMASESTSAKSRDKSDNKIDGYESAAGPENSKSGGEIEYSQKVADRSESNIINSDDDSSESVAAPNHSDSGGKKNKKKRHSRCESLSSCVVSFRF